MSKNKHTPGPWSIYFDSQDALVIRKMFPSGDESHVVARCHSGAANARLIAAAPELYTLAERIAHLNKDAEEIGAGMLASLVDEANRIIAKA